MATLTLPLTQNTRPLEWDYFQLPRRYSVAEPIHAQHIYSVMIKLVFTWNIQQYTAWWHDDHYNYYTYSGPGAEPREEIPTYWNFSLFRRESWQTASVYRVLQGGFERQWTPTREEFASKTISRTEYLTRDLTNEEEAALIEYINLLDSVQVDGWYEQDNIGSGKFPVYQRDDYQPYEYTWYDSRINLLPESCLIINYLPVGSIKAPTGAYAPASAPVQNVPLLWQAPQKTENETWDVEITHYAIWRCDTVDGTYVKVGETDGPALNYSDTTATPGTTWYYKIQACSEEIPLYNSELSAPTAGTYVNHAPGAITIETGQGGTTYNPRPRILATLGADADNVMLQLAAEGYTASRASAAPGERVAFIRTTAMETAGTESVTITEADPAGNVVSAEADAIYTVPAWTDVPVIAGTTIVKAAHINELRAQLEELCEYYGLDAPEWSEDVTAGTTPSVRFASHATELQNVVRAIAAKINGWDTKSSRCNVALPSLIEPQRPLASVINQLRDIIKIL